MLLFHIILSENTHLVKYYCITNGGNDCLSNNEYLVTGTPVDLTKTGTKDNYDFAGWNTDKDSKEVLTELTVEDTDITLYAIFKEKDKTAPIIDNISTSTTSNSITVVVAAHDDESGISKYEFSINDGEYIDNGNNNVYTFTNLKSGTNYNIKVRVTNGVEMQADKETDNSIDITDDVTTTGDGLYADEYEEGKYIYKGANPNNYIEFNNELWRILSAENDKTIKIVKNDLLANKSWDDFFNSNNWTSPATLNIYLNETYLNTLKETNKIVNHSFAIGGVIHNNNDINEQINNETTIKWNGKIGLITLSEYLRTNSNISKCLTYTSYTNNYNTCISTTWLFNSSGSWWTLSPVSSFSNMVFRIDKIVSIGGDVVYSSSGVRPALYLSSDILLSGTGTKNDPFQIIN